MLDLCYNEENFCLRRDLWKNTFYAIHPGHHYAWDCFTNTIYYASDGLVWHRCWFGGRCSSLGLLAQLTTSHVCHFHLLRFNLLQKLGIERLFFPSFDRDYDRICHSDYQPPFPLSGNHLDWAGIAFPQCVASSLIQANRPRQLGHSDHLVYHFYGDVHSDRLFCSGSYYQSHFLAKSWLFWSRLVLFLLWSSDS